MATAAGAINMVARQSVGKLVPSSTAFLLCDIQERFVPLIHKSTTVVQTSRLLTSISKELDIPLVVTEQYKKVFGPTASECFADPASDLQDSSGSGNGSGTTNVFEKKLFSMLTPEVKAHMNSLKESKTTGSMEYSSHSSYPKSCVLFGIEAHVCVLQTCLDLLEEGVEVHVVTDACSSMKLHDREVALERMRQSGAFLTTAQSLIFQLMKSADHPKFKTVSKLIKEHAHVDNEFNLALLQQYDLKKNPEDNKADEV
jgi:isochorismate hydrolase